MRQHSRRRLQRHVSRRSGGGGLSHYIVRQVITPRGTWRPSRTLPPACPETFHSERCWAYIVRDCTCRTPCSKPPRRRRTEAGRGVSVPSVESRYTRLCSTAHRGSGSRADRTDRLKVT